MLSSREVTNLFVTSLRKRNATPLGVIGDIIGDVMVRVAVLMGGKTPEHEISLISGCEVVKNLPTSKYQVSPVVISRDGREWRLVDKRSFLQLARSFTPKKIESDWYFPESRKIERFTEFSELFDAVFIAMHGPFGEDGTVQGMLDLLGVRYTGSGVLASSLGMNKLAFRRVMEAEGIAIPKYLPLTREDADKNERHLSTHFPLFVKPCDQGSSVGTTVVRDRGGLREAIHKALKFSSVALVDEYVRGTEVTCGILGNQHPQALPLVEVVPANEYFDYESKYEDVGTEEIVPARISPQMTKEVQEVSLSVYKILGCLGFSRVDLILREEREPVVLEINTIPGLTPMSLLPKAAEAAGISYSQLVDRIVQLALE